jgi:hypothetical protein
MASVQAAHVHKSCTESLEEVEKGYPVIKGTRVVETLREWVSEAWVGFLTAPTNLTAPPDTIAMLWDSVLNGMCFFCFEGTDWQEPTALRQQLKGLKGTVCHQRLWMTLEHSPAAREVDQAVKTWFKGLETKRVMWGKVRQPKNI